MYYYYILFVAEIVIDRAVDLRYIGGIYAGNVKPTPFLCLSLKMLQLQPDKDIVIEFIRQEDYKFVIFFIKKRINGRFHWTLVVIPALGFGTAVASETYYYPCFNLFVLYIFKVFAGAWSDVSAVNIQFGRDLQISRTTLQRLSQVTLHEY